MRMIVKLGAAVMLALGLAAAAPAQAQISAQTPYLYGERISYSNGFRGQKTPTEIASEKAAADAAEAACASGALAGCASLGEAFMQGEGRPLNRPVAELVLRRACNAAEARACYLLAVLLPDAINDVGMREALELAGRACRLGSADGCILDAMNVEYGRVQGLGPKEADARRRENCARGLAAVCIDLGERLAGANATPAERVEGRALLGGLCDKGNADACYALAWTMNRFGDGPADKAQAIALFDRNCRAGHRPSCSSAADNIRDTVGASDPRFAAYQDLACKAGDVFSCLSRARVREREGAEGRAAAITLYERACAANAYACTRAADLRSHPAVATRCESGDQQACLTLAGWMATKDGAFEDLPRAAQLYTAACDAGVIDGCLPAGRLLIEADGISPGNAAAARAEAYLARACTAAGGPACTELAEALVAGTALSQDIPRAMALYADACDAGSKSACEFIAERETKDPSVPLILASGLAPPELSPEEQAAARQAEAERFAREEAENRERACRVTEVLWEGRIYIDQNCVNISASIGGVAVRRIELAPWQALLWRPATLRGRTVGFRTACGGAVVRTGWILTAAHCTYDQGLMIEDHDYRIRLGVLEPDAPDGNTYPIVQVIRHPNFLPDTFQFDLALIQYDPARGLKGDFAFGARRIALDTRTLAQRPVRATAPVFAYGWGRTSLNDPTPSKILQSVRLELEDAATCTQRTAYRDWRKDSVLCAMGRNREQACTGDSGGPLVTFEDQSGVPTLIGVVSSGEKCSTTGVPSRYIRIGHPAVQKWLVDNLPGFVGSVPPSGAR